MANNSEFGFEKNWQGKLSRALEDTVGEGIRDQVLTGAVALTDDTPVEEKIRWTTEMFTQLAKFTNEKTRQGIMTRCACQYPVEDLEDARDAYRATELVAQAIFILQENFELLLRETLELEENLIEEILQRGWGVAGHREGNSIISTKIPKSGSLREYFQETDPIKKRRLCCHCPRVRDGIGSEPKLPEDYCYCGAGFYKGIWEEILGEPVEVEVLESVIRGDDVCKIAIHLPESQSTR